MDCGYRKLWISKAVDESQVMWRSGGRRRESGQQPGFMPFASPLDRSLSKFLKLKKTKKSGEGVLKPLLLRGMLGINIAVGETLKDEGSLKGCSTRIPRPRLLLSWSPGCMTTCQEWHDDWI